MRKGIIWVQAGRSEAREKVFAAGAHALDSGYLEGEVQGRLVRLRDVAQEENVVVAGNDEDDFVVAGRVRGNGQRALDFGEVGAVVDDADKGPTQGEAGWIPGKFGGGEASGVDDHVGAELSTEAVFLVEEVAMDGCSSEFGAFTLYEKH